jgi:DNA-binding response OmpR family regulator
MYPADPKLLVRLEPCVRRVLIVDPNSAQARLLADQMKALGARDVLFEPEERRALDLARDADPSIVFVERSGPKLDGESFSKRLRRSTFTCRKAPIIMVTADATAGTIKAARDSGVHEFMRKPFTAGDLLKRVEVVALKPRDWIEAVQYVGPDRRRFNSGEYAGPRKRQADTTGGDNHAQQMDQAVRILHSALIQFDRDPAQAWRAITQQSATLKAIAVIRGEARLAVAVANLEMALSAGAPTRATLAAPVKAILDLFEVNSPVRAA